MKWLEAVQDLWKLLWIPTLMIALCVAICQFLSPLSVENLKHIIESSLEKYSNLIDLISQNAAKFHLDILPMILTVSVVAMFLQFLRGPLFIFVLNLPPHIGWFSGRSLRFASKIDLALLKKRYPNSESFTMAYSMALDQLRKDAAHTTLFEGPMKTHHYFITFSKYCCFVTIAFLIGHIIFGQTNRDFLLRCVVILSLSAVLWIMATYRLIIHIRNEDFLQWQAIRTDLHHNSEPLQEGEELKYQLSADELAILDGRWWYIRLSPSTHWFSFKEIIRGFRGMD